MNINSITRKTRFLTKADVNTGLVVTIDRVEMENVAPPGQRSDQRPVLYFEDGTKPLVLNSTNGRLIAEALGTSETEEWSGQQIEVYHDPNVTFAGKVTGGIRVRTGTNPF
jgi:hypothetical protein